MTNPHDELIKRIEEALNTDEPRARQIVDSFITFIATPLARKLDEANGRDIAKRNPFVYASLGIDKSNEWVDRVLADQLISRAEGLIGNWIEDVARIMSGGVKPGGGSDLQVERPDGVVDLYAIQMTTNTKNSGGGRSDRTGLDASSRVLTAHRRHVDRYVGYIFGRRKTTQRGGVTHLSSEDFWERIVGDREFLPKLLHACTLLGQVYSLGTVRDVARVRVEAAELYGDRIGGIDWKKVIIPPPRRGNAKS